MDKDVVPGLLESIQKDFDKGIQKSSVIKQAKQLLNDKKATYQDVNDYAIEVGEKLSKALQAHITTETLPDGKMYFNIADRILRTTMTKNHELITEYASEVQEMMNQQAGIKLKPQIPNVDESKVKGIIERVVHEDNFDKIKWILDDPIVTFSQGIVDDAIEKNVEFHAQVGLTPKIVRRASSFCCDWCQSLVGSFEYGQEPKDVYKRHGNCRCTVDYIPKGGKRKKDVWSKKWTDDSKKKKERVKEITNTVTVKEIKEKINKINLTTATPNDIIKLGKEINDHFEVSKHIGDKEKLKEIFSNFREIGGSVPKETWAKGSSREAKKQLQEAFSNYPKDWAMIPQKNERQLLARKNERGFFIEGAVEASGLLYDTKYDNFKNGYYTIVVDGYDKTTPYHEIGHMVEKNNSDIVRLEKEWVEKRTQGEEYSRLKDVFLDSRYGDHEVTKKDNFVDPYIGKVYDDAAEVLTMGLQGIFVPESKFLKQIEYKDGKLIYTETTILDDPEFLNFVIGLFVKG